MRMPVKLPYLLLMVMMAFIPVWCQNTPAGTLLRDRIVEKASVSQSATLLGGYPYTLSIHPKYPIEYHAVTYTTTDIEGKPTIASGMVIIPVGADRLPVISYQHGTVVKGNEAPSSPQNTEMELMGLIYTSTGYLVVVADYLGLGVNPGLHPYLHAATEASACRDMLRASQMLCHQLHLTWGPQLFLAGYSQGGHATMALHRLLQEDLTHEFTVTASAPQSGPYDLSNTEFQFALKRNENRALSVSAAYTLYAYNRIYQIYPTIGIIFTPRYAELVPHLFNNRHNYYDIYRRMPESPRNLLNAPFRSALLADPLHPMRLALHQNDVYDWRPTAPVRLYFIPNDTIVSAANAHVAYTRMHELGADVQLVNLGRAHTHTSAFIPAQVATWRWFGTLR
jgi:hypothetical protein